MIFLGQRGFHRLIQIGNGYSVCEPPMTLELIDRYRGDPMPELRKLDLRVLAVRSPDGELLNRPASERPLSVDDTIILYGPDQSHDAIDSVAPRSSRSESMGHVKSS